MHHIKDEEGAGIRNLLMPSLSCSDAYHQKNWPSLNRPLVRMPIFDSQTGLMAVLESGPEWDETKNDWA